MLHDAGKYLVDISLAAKDVQQFVGSMSFDDYHSNKLVKAAVERKFEVMGEALSRLARVSPDIASAIQDYQKIISFRNLVIHGYDVVSDPLVWDVIQNKIPPLIENVDKLRLQ